MTVRISIACIAMTILPLAVSAQEGASYRCVNGDQIRRVEVAHPTGAPAPCEVRYYKDTEAPGRSETPWRADNEAGYCADRAAELVSRLQGFGWSCAAAAAAPIADDTDALGAGPRQ